MRRSAFFPVRPAGRPDKGNYLESGEAISDKKQKTLAPPVIFVNSNPRFPSKGERQIQTE